jgi:hypothetical protein
MMRQLPLPITYAPSQVVTRQQAKILRLIVKLRRANPDSRKARELAEQLAAMLATNTFPPEGPPDPPFPLP